MQKLIVFKGKPGVGKSTIALALARELDYIYIDKDQINNLVFETVGASRESSNLVYRLILHFVEILLKRGESIVVDCSLSHKLHYDLFKKLAKKTGVSLLVVEVKLEDREELVRRLDSRKNLPKHRIKKLEDIKKQDLEYEIYEVPERILVDATRPVKDNLLLIKEALKE